VKKRDDEEEHLMLMEMCVLTLDAQDMNQKVFLNERKVILKLQGTQNIAWYLDTGASNHMTSCRERFAELDTKVTGSVKFGDGSIVEICGKGSVLFECQNGEHWILTEVYYIPRLRSNIISIGQLDEYGCKMLVEDGFMTLWDRARKVLARVKRSSNWLYVLNIKQSKPKCWLAKSMEDAWLWHARYSHVNFHALKKLADKEMVNDMPQIDHIERVCDGCLVGKQHRASFPAVSSFRATGPLELLHGDLCGPISQATNAGKKYFLLLVDDFSRFMWIVLIRTKDEAFEAFLKVKAATEMELQLQVRSLCTNRGGEFISREFSAYCEEKGIKRFITAPYSPQPNGVVERRNQTVVAMARSLLKSKNLPNMFWGEAVTTAVYLLNRALTKSVTHKTPYEVFYGRKPNVAHLRTFGCIGHVKKATPHLTKLQDHIMKMVFIGYETSAHSKAYRMYDPVAKKVHISRDVVFEEDKDWAWSSEPSGKENTGEPFIVEFSTHIDAGVEVSYSGEEGVLDTSQDNGQIDKDDSDVDHDPELQNAEVLGIYQMGIPAT
jgi:transposase InsO family protein